MNDSKISKNFIYNVSYQILVLIVPLVTLPYITRVLGADGIGKVSYAQSVVAYFTLFATMGTATFGQREISYVRDDREKASAVFWETKLLSLAVSSAVLALYCLFSLIQSDRRLYLVLSFSVLSVTADVTWFFQGMEDFGKIVARNMAAKLLGLAYVFLFVKTPDDVGRYAFSLTFFTFLGNVTLWAELPKYISPVPLSKLRPFRNLRTVFSLFIPTVAIQIYTVLDKTMIGLITRSDAENGYYEQAVMISKMALAIVTALGTVLVPRIAYYYEKKDTAALKSLMYKAYRFVWFLGTPMCLGLIVVSRNFVPWFYGPGFEKVAALIGVLAFLIPAIGISNVTGIQYLIPTGQQNLLTKTVLIGAAVNFSLNLFLIRFFKSTGAAAASIAAESVISFVQLRFLKNEFSGTEIVKSGKNYFISGAAMFAVLTAAAGILPPSPVSTLILIILGAAVYFADLLLLRDPFLLETAEAARSRIGRNSPRHR